MDVRDGVYIQSSPHGVIRRNRARDLRYGLHYMNSDDNIFEDNVFENGDAGTAIMYSRRLVFRRNQFLRNRGFASVGLLLKSCDDVLAEHNLIADNARGVFIEGSDRIVIRENVIAQSDIALVIFASTSRATITGNSFVGNLAPLSLVGRRTDTAIAGNYWSDNDALDLDGDGRTDRPYRLSSLFDHLRGNLTAADLFSRSLSAAAIAAAERSLPVLEAVPVLDPAPLARPPVLPVPVQARRAGGAAAAGLLASASVLLLGRRPAAGRPEDGRMIRFTGVTKRFAGRVAVGGLTVDMKPGQVDGAARSQRIRQDDDAEDGRGADPAGRGDRDGGRSAGVGAGGADPAGIPAAAGGLSRDADRARGARVLPRAARRARGQRRGGAADRVAERSRSPRGRHVFGRHGAAARARGRHAAGRRRAAPRRADGRAGSRGARGLLRPGEPRPGGTHGPLHVAPGGRRAARRGSRARPRRGRARRGSPARGARRVAGRARQHAASGTERGQRRCPRFCAPCRRAAGRGRHRGAGPVGVARSPSSTRSAGPARSSRPSSRNPRRSKRCTRRCCQPLRRRDGPAVKAARLLVVLCVAASACRPGAVTPVPLQAGTACSNCRMTVVEPTLASQLVAPGEEPRFFDDIGCLTAYLATHPSGPADRAFVADHATGAWIDAARAVYTRAGAIATPMNSHLVAHENARARDADASVRGGVPLTVADVFGPRGVPGGDRDR